MTDTTNPNLFALLIGVDCYMPNHLPDGSIYKNLGGCVRDINHVEAFLKDFKKVPENQIIKLTASPSEADEKMPSEPPEKRPTRQNMISAFRQLGELAPANSQVYIHYSGHGGRAKTIFVELKGQGEIDEGLVPTDIGTPEGQYLRDLELALLLKELVDKKLVVTLILDCCHSGGATRGEAEVRGMDVEDDKPPHADFEPIASPEVLEALWQSLTTGNTRGLKVGGLPESNDYVLLAACRQNEFAFEFPFNRETREKNGALTYWLLDTLKQPFSGQTYQDLFERIHAKIHSQFLTQTPVLLGQANRKIFSSEFGETVVAVNVRTVETNEKGEQFIELEAGQANGVDEGVEFAIYPLGKTNKEDQIAIATVIEQGASLSRCSVEAISGKKAVEQGDQAIQISASVDLIRRISLLPEGEPALDVIAQAIPGNGWLELAKNGSRVDYIVGINDEGEYEICDSGDQPFKNINPPVKIGEQDAATKIIKRLIHLAKYKATSELDNWDSDSPLAGKLKVEWLGTSSTWKKGKRPPQKGDESLTSLVDPTKPSVKVGDWIFLWIKNESSKALNITALNLDAEWAISKIHPQNEAFEILESGREKVIPLKPSLDGQDGKAVENTLKVFGTIDASDYEVLTLPSLDQPLPSGRGTRSLSALANLLKAIDDEQPKTRKLDSSVAASEEWTVKQVVVTITP